MNYRLYIDESGDHTYKHLDNPDTRYLGLTGVLFKRDHYIEHVEPELEDIKRRLFKYDPDDPPILVRNVIKHRKRWFYVLQDKSLNEEWEAELLSYFSGLVKHCNIFTVVMDKKEHLKNYPLQTFDPYSYCLHVLLNRVRGLLIKRGEQADVLAESRGGIEDKQIMHAYRDLRVYGSYYGGGEYYRKVYPEEQLLIRRKDNNVAGLQIADVVAYGQKVITIMENDKPFPRSLGEFEAKLNEVVDKMVNQYGRYLLK